MEPESPVRTHEDDEGQLLDSFLNELDQAMDMIDMSEPSRELLRSPQYELRFQIPTKMQDGSVEIYRAFRVQWNMARGPVKGGLRFHLHETIDTIRVLAGVMALKTALMNLQLGGGKGGVICNPKEMSDHELEQVCRGYIRHLGRQLGPDSDVPAPDLYTNSHMMAWMMDEYETLTGRNVSGVVTGKPVELGGSAGRSGATARGGIITIREAAKVLDLYLEDRTVAIQGYGKAGSAAHKLVTQELGMNVVAVSDTKGGIYNDRGLDYEEVLESKQKTGSVVNYPTAETIDSDDLLELDVCVVIPAALENVIHEYNASEIQAEIVAELANGATTPVANEILKDRGIFVIPDLLCSAGGLTVSYFEQVQNSNNYYWYRDTVLKRLDKRMTTAFHEVYEKAIDKGVHNRLAAYMLAVERIKTAMELRGWT